MGIALSFQRGKRNSCDHRSVLIDDELWQITCAKCGEVLDPIAYMVRLAKEESYQNLLVNSYKKEVEELKNKLNEINRCKCEHCGKFTKIDKKLRV